jgi:hypothetical protein
MFDGKTVSVFRCLTVPLHFTPNNARIARRSYLGVRVHVRARPVALALALAAVRVMREHGLALDLHHLGRRLVDIGFADLCVA